MIVVDTMVLAHLVVRGDWTAESQAVRAIDPDWVAPILWRSEFRNVLTKLMRAREMTVPEATRHMISAEKVMRGLTLRIGSRQILALTASSSCTAYDCEFVALAKSRGVPLVTRDKEVLREFPETAQSARDFVRTRS